MSHPKHGPIKLRKGFVSSSCAGTQFPPVVRHGRVYLASGQRDRRLYRTEESEARGLLSSAGRPKGLLRSLPHRFRPGFDGAPLFTPALAAFAASARLTNRAGMPRSAAPAAESLRCSIPVSEEPATQVDKVVEHRLGSQLEAWDPLARRHDLSGRRPAGRESESGPGGGRAATAE